jgi:hypothetical protein
MGRFLLVLLFGSQSVGDPSKVDLCQRVPGTEVARLFGKELKRTVPFASEREFSRCTYQVANPGSSEVVGYSLWLHGPENYDEVLPYTENVLEKLTGFGDEAILYREDDGLSKLRLVVRNRFTLQATAQDVDSVKKLAKLALEHLSR